MEYIIPEELKKKLKGTIYPDPEQVVYEVTVEDMLFCIINVLGEDEVIELSPKELERLIELGIEGSESIDWSTPIENMLFFPPIEKKRFNEEGGEMSYEKAVAHSKLVSKLIKRVQESEFNFDTDREVFVITVGDIVECIADVYGKDALKLPMSEIDELIRIGEKSTEWLMWSETITDAIKDRRFYDRLE